jgi:hypothetical protein
MHETEAAACNYHLDGFITLTWRVGVSPRGIDGVIAGYPAVVFRLSRLAWPCSTSTSSARSDQDTLW